MSAEANPLGDPREGHGFTLHWDEWSCQFWGFAPALTSQMSEDVKALGVETFQRQGQAGKCRQSLADTAFLGQKSKQPPGALLRA